MRTHFLVIAFSTLFIVAFAASSRAKADGPAQVFSILGDYATGLGEASAETIAYDDDLLFVTNSTDNSLDIVDISDPAQPQRIKRISLARFGTGPNSVDVYRGIVAVAVDGNPRTSPGNVVFFDRTGRGMGQLKVGAVPDMLTFTPDGKKLLVANEGEPSSYGQPNSVDPEGTISVITLRLIPGQLPSTWIPGTVKTVDFRAFNVGGSRHAELDPGIRIFGPNATVAQDLEPEYIAISPDSRTAYVTLQEANALAVVDIAANRVTALRPLGLKNHNLAGAGLDASDRDSAINIAPWPVFGMFMPDAVSLFQAGGTTYLATANEGDARDYTGFAEEIRVGAAGYVLDPTAFPNAAALKANAQLGRLTVSRSTGNTDGDGDFDRIDVFGSRSFSIWNAATGALVFDSGDAFEQTVAAALPANFNASNNNNTFDDRSDNKGPEPEGIAIGHIDGQTYAFVGLERIGGMMVYDITDPLAPEFVQYANNRSFAGLPAGPDSGPEVIRFISAALSPNGQPLVLTANEISGTVGIYRAEPAN
jgi:DNA-binding beta-propeller fold protein YncE